MSQYVIIFVIFKPSKLESYILNHIYTSLVIAIFLIANQQVQRYELKRRGMPIMLANGIWIQLKRLEIDGLHVKNHLKSLHQLKSPQQAWLLLISMV